MLPHPLRSVSLRTLTGAACLALSGAAGILAAGDPVYPAAPRPAGPGAAEKPTTVSNVALARTALAAIDADPVLKNVNLVVSIVDRVAVVGGPVATEEIRRRVEEVVRRVPGITAVKNTCVVYAEPDLLLRAVATQRMKPDATPTEVAALPGVALPPSAPAGSLPPLPPPAPSDLVVAAAPAREVTAQHPTVPLVGILGGPVAPAGTGAAARVQPLPPGGALPTAALPTAPGSLTGATAPEKPTDLPATVAAIRKADARFARLLVEVKPDGGLFVSGWSARAADAWDFAAELRKVPGVARVAVDPKLVK